jgi:RNA polymerase subunit RPABC4/transcription elongation factor Spt4
MAPSICSHCGNLIPPGEDECPICEADIDEPLFEDEEFPDEE